MLTSQAFRAAIAAAAIAISSAAAAQAPAAKSADDLYVAGRYAEAYALYQQRALANPYDLDAQDGVTASAAKMGKVKEALAWYESKPSGVPAWCYGGARAMFADDQRKEASALAYRGIDIARAAQDEARVSRAYFLLGMLYATQAMPDYPTAINAFRRAIALEPRYGPSYYQLALLEAGFRGQSAEAKALVGKALLYLTPVQNEVRVESHVLCGALLSADRNYAEALKQYEAARDLAGDAIYEKVNIGRVHELMGEPEAAAREWGAVQKRFGLASPIGLAAYRSIRRVTSKAAVDFSDFLPGGTPEHYLVLTTRLVKAKAPEAMAVPVPIAKLLEENKVPVRCAETDLLGDGKLETVVVEAKAAFDKDLKGYLPAKPTLYVFTSKGGQLGRFDSMLDCFWDARVVDFSGDGKKEIVFAGFNAPNTLNLTVVTHQDRRFRPTFAQPIQCLASACGALIDDLDGDGKLEILTVDGGDLWVTVFRWNDKGTFDDASADFPQFYTDYVKRYERLRPEELEQYPIVKRHLRDAHMILLAGAKKRESAEKAP